MENKELYPELREYIFQYCGKYFWRKQKNLGFELTPLLNSDAANIGMYKILLQGGSILDNENFKDLTNDSYEAYKHRISELIFREHKDELGLNLCPKCGKIARTPLAKQCRFCFYDWHNK
ncbi:MAG: hypothetical protein QM802_14045 [Agriterribacter sp.]